jgi:hypothetical protein
MKKTAPPEPVEQLPNPEDVLRRMLSTPPKEHDTKPAPKKQS